MLSGILFDIKEFAIHDGPGIRMTVFMKGCPLQCSWCQNPEGISSEPQVMHRADSQRIVGKWYLSLELADIINDKADILRANEGGVTFSGGEPLQQAEFIAEVVDLLDGVHVLLDTSGYGSERDFRLLAERSDLVFFDLKLIDNKIHRDYTGRGNDLIIHNLNVLGSLNVPFVVRIPLIPGITDTDNNFSEIAKVIKDFPNLIRVDLLPYNRMAGGKYSPVGMKFSPGFDESGELNCTTEIFENEGLEVHIL